MNAMARLGFEHANNDAAVQRFNNYTTKSTLMCEYSQRSVVKNIIL